MIINNLATGTSYNVMTTKEDEFSRGVLKYDIDRDLYILVLRRRCGEHKEIEFDCHESINSYFLKEIIENN